MTPQTTTDSGSKSPRTPSALFGLSKAELDAIEVLGFELYQQGRTAEANTIFEGLIVLAGNRHRGYAGKGALALAEEKLDEALGWLSQAAERNTSDATVRANLGETLLRLGRFSEAAAEFGKALELDPAGTDPGANRARAILAGMKTAMENFAGRPPEEQQSDPDSDN